MFQKLTTNWCGKQGDFPARPSLWPRQAGPGAAGGGGHGGHGPAAPQCTRGGPKSWEAAQFPSTAPGQQEGQGWRGDGQPSPQSWAPGTSVLCEAPQPQPFLGSGTGWTGASGHPADTLASDTATCRRPGPFCVSMEGENWGQQSPAVPCRLWHPAQQSLAAKGRAGLGPSPL